MTRVFVMIVDNDARDVASRKVQPRPPQPPKQPLQTGFALSNFGALLDDEDAESWYNLILEILISHVILDLG